MVYPALAAAAGLWLARLRPAPARALAGASAAVTALALALFGVEQRHPRLLAGTIAVERFHGWEAMAAEARVLLREACAEVGCDPAQPYLVPGSYQYAAQLAYYGGYRRLGPAVSRPSQLDVWDDRPDPGEPVVFAGQGAPDPNGLRIVRVQGEGSSGQRRITYGGQRLRDLVVKPYARSAGAVPPG
jgi:hypothetical protein